MPLGDTPTAKSGRLGSFRAPAILITPPPRIPSPDQWGAPIVRSTPFTRVVAISRSTRELTVPRFYPRRIGKSAVQRYHQLDGLLRRRREGKTGLSADRHCVAAGVCGHDWTLGTQLSS